MKKEAGDWEHAKFLLTNFMQEYSDEYDKCEYGPRNSVKEMHMKILKKAVVTLYNDNTKLRKDVIVLGKKIDRDSK